MATFAERITDLIGSEYLTIASNSVQELFTAAINEVVDMVPSDLLLKYAVGPILLDNGTPTWTSVEGRKVLLVTRLDASGGVGRQCNPVTLQDWELVQDANSLYLATKHSPVFTYTTAGGDTALSIYPTPTADETAKIYYYAYNTADTTANSTFSYLPEELEQAIILKSCINLLQTYISDFCQDEEDQEMLQMLQGQAQTLQALYQTEMSRYQLPDATPRGE